jgi:hypothetical protein
MARTGGYALIAGALSVRYPFSDAANGRSIAMRDTIQRVRGLRGLRVEGNKDKADSALLRHFEATSMSFSEVELDLHLDLQ